MGEESLNLSFEPEQAQDFKEHAFLRPWMALCTLANGYVFFGSFFQEC